jgi:WD40 repeat protein
LTLACNSPPRPSPTGYRCDGELTRWNVEARAPEAGPRPTPEIGDSPFADSVAVTDDGSLVATGHPDGTVSLYDARTLTPVGAPLDLSERDGFLMVGTLDAGTSDGRNILAASNLLDEVAVWDLDQRPVRLLARGGNTQSVEITPSGRVATAPQNGIVSLRDPDTLEPVGEGVSGSLGTPTMTFSQAERRSWRRPAPRARFACSIAPRASSSVAPMPAFLRSTIHPDGSAIFVGAGGDVQPSAGAAVLRLSLDPDDWQRTACEAAGRNLTPTEWRRYLPQDQPHAATCPQWPTGP